jgi:hypothetical protein
LSHEEGAAVFSRHRYELPLLTVFLCLALLELIAVHFLMSMWSVTAAWVLTVLSAVAVVQIALLIRGLIQNPTVVDRNHVHVRHGRAGQVSVPLSDIVKAEFVAFAPEEQGRHVFRASLIASPNIALHLGKPVQIRRSGRTLIALRLDEPQAFLSTLAERRTLASQAG